MKIIRPEYTSPKKVEETVQIGKITWDYEEKFKTDMVIEKTMNDLMAEVIKEELTNPNHVKVTITLTKKQAEMFDKKGGVKWLKKALVGQKYKRVK